MGGKPVGPRHALCFTVPFALPADSGSGAETVAATSLQGEQLPAVPPLRILLAEDNRANQKVATYILNKLGHSVEVAANGQRAVERVGNEDFDMVLMDVQMPMMDGFQATSAIRALRPS